MSKLERRNPMIALIAKLPVKPERLQDAIDLIKPFIEKVSEEKGTLSYTLNQDKSDPNTLVILERYKDAEALKYHGQTPHFKDFSSQIGNLLSGKPAISHLEELHSI